MNTFRSLLLLLALSAGSVHATSPSTLDSPVTRTAASSVVLVGDGLSATQPIHPNAAAQPRVLENAWPTLAPLLLN